MVQDLAFTGNQRQIISASSDRTIKFWDFGTGKLDQSLGSPSPIHSLAMSNADSCFATGHLNGAIRIWSASQMRQMSCIDNVHVERIEHLQFTPDGKQIVSLGRDHTIQVTDFGTRKQVACIENSSLLMPKESCFDISPQGKYLAVGGQDGSVFIFDMKTFQVEEIFKGKHITPVVGC